MAWYLPEETEIKDTYWEEVNMEVACDMAETSITQVPEKVWKVDSIMSRPKARMWHLA